MDKTYNQGVLLFKALSDPHRLMIVDMLSCRELCACVILEKFNITQPTLSHHMRILCDSGLVCGRKEGKWTYYSLNNESVKNLQSLLEEITTTKQNCICNEIPCKIECK
ncbi:MAG: metalloregulator ArsR/SmtB family transcription factor [Spirochaetes bacterium]|nr:metalloregulator ArsR/SmtB family transcription factor [Spirochaetota bacterium]